MCAVAKEEHPKGDEVFVGWAMVDVNRVQLSKLIRFHLQERRSLVDRALRVETPAGDTEVIKGEIKGLDRVLKPLIRMVETETETPGKGETETETT